MKTPAFPIASHEYRAIGLLANPFLGPSSSDALDAAGNAVAHAEAVSLIRAMDTEAEADRSRPIWVTKGEHIPDYYSRMSLGQVLSSVPASSEMNVLVAYVPFFMMRRGRIRSALTMVAERLAGETFGRTLGMYAAAAFLNPDDELLISAGITREESLDLARRFEENPDDCAAQFFGEDEYSRETGKSVDDMLQTTSLRQLDLDLDPEPHEEESDVSIEDTLGEDIPEALPEETIPAERTYLIEHTRKHISPVVARALRKYVDEGVYALAQELKITKGPRKALAALTKFACHRYRKVVLVYDQFDSWHNAPEDLRIRIAGSLAEIRMLLGKDGIMVFMAGDQQLEEIHHQFLGAREVEWTMAPMLEDADPVTGLQPGLIDFLLDAVRIGSIEQMDELRRLLEEAGAGVGSERLEALADAVDAWAAGK